MRYYFSKPVTRIGLFIICVLFLFSCNSANEQSEQARELIDKAYENFRAGNNEMSISQATEALSIGKEIGNDTIIGDALTGLCRAALRDRNSDHLSQLSEELSTLASNTGNDKWMMIRAHMNAEMARMNGDLEKAAGLYDESMRISKSIGSRGMYAADHFNKSFIAVAQNDFEESRSLISSYYEIRKEINPEVDDAYGLIALANMLVGENNLFGAAEVTSVARRLFLEQDIVPDPADEKPLVEAEAAVEEQLPQATLDSLQNVAQMYSVNTMLEKYLYID